MAQTPGDSISTTQSAGAQSLDGWFRDPAQSNAPSGASPAPAGGGLNAWFDEPKPAAQQQAGAAPAFSPISTEALDQVAAAEGLTPKQRQVMGALLEQESGSGRNVRTSVDGARGAGQILPDTFRRYAKAGERIDDPASNLAVSARIIKDLGGKSGDDPARIATGYFSGSGNINSGAGNAWRNDAADGNGKRVSSYVTDVLGRLTGSAPAVAAEPAAPANPLASAPKWAAVTAKPEYQALSDADKQGAREAYFQRFIAPNIGQGEEPKYREWFDKQTAGKNSDAGESHLSAAASYLGKSLKAGGYDLAGAGAKVLDAINPFTLSESDAAVLFKNDPAKLKQYQDDSTAMILSRFAKRMTKNSEESMAEMTDRAKRDYGSLEYATTDTGKAAYLSPTKVIGDALRSLPSSAAMAVSVYVTRGAAANAERTALAAGLSPEVARQAAVAAGAKAMATTGAASEGIVGYGQQANQSAADVEKIPMSEMKKSPKFQQLVRQGFKPEAARAKIIADTAEQAGVIAGIVDAAVNKVGGEFLGKILTEGGKLIPRIMKGAANESATEFVQSAGEQVGQNRALQENVDPNQSLTQGVGEAAVAGAAVGGLMGGVMSGVAGRGHDAVQPATPEAPPGADRVDPVMGESGEQPVAEQMALPTWLSEQQAADPEVRAYIEQSAQGGDTAGIETSLAQKYGDDFTQTLDFMAGQPPFEGSEQPADAIPAQTGMAGIADQDVLDYADSRYRQLVAQRDGEVGAVAGEDGDVTEGDVAGGGLSADEAAELALLQQNRGNARALSAQYGFDTSQPGKDEVDAGAHEAASSPTNDLTPPTVAQASAGNYKKGSVKLHGLDIAIENPQGSTRSGVADDGTAWSSTLTDGHYGYVRGTKGADGDAVDVFVGPTPQSTKAFVIDQIDPKTGRFDETKTMLGYNSEAEASAAYHANHEAGWNGMGNITETTTDAFKAWLNDGDTTKPFSNGPFMPGAAEVPEAAELVRRHRAALTDYKAAALAGDEQAAQAAAAALASARADMDTAQQNVAARAQAMIQEAADAPLPKPKTEKQARKQRAAKTTEKESKNVKAQPTATTDGRPSVQATATEQPDFKNGTSPPKKLDQPGRPAAAARSESGAGTGTVRPSATADRKSALSEAQAKHARQDEEVRKAAANIAARAAAKEAAKEQVATPAQTALIDQAVKSKIITPGSLRAERFRAGIMDATSGTAPASAERSYLEGHAWALAKQSGAAPAAPAAKPKTEKAAKAARAAEPTTEDVNDEMYQQAVDTVLKSGSASVSLVQRHLKIGYNRVQRIMEQMEANGVVGPMASNGSREIIKKPAASKSKKTLADQKPAKGDLPDLNDIDLTQDGPVWRESEPVRINTLAKLKSLEKRLAAGKITAAEYQMAIQSLIGKLETRNEVQQDKKARPRERGELWLRERLLRAKRTGELSADQVDFALWALDQNPNIANDLGISLRESKNDGVAGSYIPGSRIIALVKGNGNMETVVHEIMHHTERMMPPAVQQGIVTEWSRAMGKAWKNGTPAVREALQNMMLSSAGDKKAYDAMMKAFRDKTLNYDAHYQLVNASEYWAVNASDILAKRADAAGRWVAQVRQWLREMIEKIKNLLNLPSSAPVLAGLQRVLDGQGKRLSNSMLVEISNSQAGAVLDGLNDLDRGKPRTEAFRKWFDGSKVKNIVYHATASDFDSFDTTKSDLGAHFGSLDQANYLKNRLAHGNMSIMPVWLSIKNPLRLKDVGTFHADGIAVQLEKKGILKRGEGKRIENEIDKDWKLRKLYDPVVRQAIIDAGYDGVIYKNTHEGDGDSYIAFEPQQIKSAIGNNGEFDPSSHSVLNSLDLRTAAQKAQAQLVDEFGKPTFSNIDWWDKSIGTQYHKAAKNPLFKKVFDLAIKRENAVSLTAVRAASLAPGFLPRIDDFMGALGTLWNGRKTGSQNDLAGKALLEGTLDGASVIDGKVWTTAELRAKGLNDEGIALYRQARAAIDASLDEVAAAEGYSTVHSFVPKSIREEVIDDPRGAQTVLSAALAKRIQLDELHLAAQQRNGASPAAVDAAKARLKQSYDVRDTLGEIYERVEQLKNAGYTPLMRFGNYTVQVEEIDPQTGKTVINPATGKPNTLYFSTFETEAEAADEYFRQQVAHRGKDNIKVTSGEKNDEAFKMFNGISPETLELFANVVGAKEATEAFYQVALSERSALKRRITRNAIAGYSENMPRVLANFITSNGKFAAQRYYNRDINNAIRYIPRVNGDVQKEAIRLKEYIDNPGNAGAIASALSFTWFLGGNIASALINATQPVMMTLPYLSQFGAGRAAAAMTKAAPYAMGRKQIMDADLKAALKRGAQEGKVDAQEIFHLYSVGIQGVASILSGKLSKLPLVGSKVKGAAESTRARINALGTLWGMPFAMVEGFNRRLTFIAAWDIAKATGQADPYAFAVDAVDQTQGVYSKVNRPNWARGPVGRVVFTFAQFKIMNVEMIKRLATMGGPEGKKAAAMYLATLILMAGLAGVPYADDVDDIIDTVGQWLGYNTNMKRTKREWAYKTLGHGFGDLALYGVSSHLPVDVAGRMGLGNFFPATGILKPSGEGNRAQDIMELGGPAVSGLGRQVFDAYDAASMGNYGKAAMTLMPTAVKNVATGVDMAATGKAKDMKGRVKTDVTAGEAFAKGIGLNPTVVAEKNRANMPINQDLALQKLTEASVVDQWAQGIVSKDKGDIDAAMARMKNWNEKNPETPVRISKQQIESKVKTLLTPTDTRLMKGAPKEMRQRVAEGLKKED